MLSSNIDLNFYFSQEKVSYLQFECRFSLILSKTIKFPIDLANVDIEDIEDIPCRVLCFPVNSYFFFLFVVQLHVLCPIQKINIPLLDFQFTLILTSCRMQMVTLSMTKMGNPESTRMELDIFQKI